MDSADSNYYETLGIDRSATTDDIKQAYRKLAVLWHPDKNSAPDANKRFQLIAQAYQVLVNENSRAAYDRQWWSDSKPRDATGYRAYSFDTTDNFSFMDPKELFACVFSGESEQERVHNFLQSVGYHVPDGAGVRIKVRARSGLDDGSYSGWSQWSNLSDAKGSLMATGTVPATGPVAVTAVSDEAAQVSQGHGPGWEYRQKQLEEYRRKKEAKSAAALKNV
eukprot:NODE_3155_length_934_cov_42.862454_g3134_i0.p1 GENE.NODE_3155_length_934_cov_42.862454_g3134_i0~~NODE_3155_length_934_cov_42.862454_g3134_i0.p1  ORF type:complete len:222 (-),score=19.26 NODE_3155_length_934_cov_42.862454_g3134_i0:127-792(-)